MAAPVMNVLPVTAKEVLGNAVFAINITVKVF